MSNCPNCGGDIAIRNPTGKCDHLHYPENVPEPPVTHKMKVQVSMDGLRQNLAREYIDLVEMFNEAYAHDWEIDKDELKDKLLELRSTIGVLHCCYDTEREHFSDLSHETSKMDIIKFTPTNE